MAESFMLARLKASVLPPARPRGVYRRSPEERAALLLATVTMAEIRDAADLLGLTFNEAYRLRACLYHARWLRGLR